MGQEYDGGNGRVPIDKTYHIAIGPSLNNKIPPGDPYWREFNGAFHNEELKQLDIATRLYDGHAITTCCDPSWRKAENYHLGQHIGLDFDTEDERSTFDHLLKDPFISKYGSILYTTPSHTPDRPRARVLFLLDTPIYQAKNYTAAASALLFIFGAADRQCKDPVRFFYGSKPGAARVEWLNNELPLSLVRDLIKRHHMATQAQRKTPRREYKSDTVDEQCITDALAHLDPWSLSYDEWLSVLMAIHSEMPGPAGLSLADTWAAGYPGEVEQKWRGFEANGNANGRVSIGTLFALAKEYA